VTHYCHARRCQVVVEPRLLMCPRHWRMVPRPLQAAVWQHYRAGQERDKLPSDAYRAAALAAVAAVEAIEFGGQQELQLLTPRRS
jgi:hypothetical protein